MPAFIIITIIVFASAAYCFLAYITYIFLTNIMLSKFKGKHAIKHNINLGKELVSFLIWLQLNIKQLQKQPPWGLFKLYIPVKWWAWFML